MESVGFDDRETARGAAPESRANVHPICGRPKAGTQGILTYDFNRYRVTGSSCLVDLTGGLCHDFGRSFVTRVEQATARAGAGTSDLLWKVRVQRDARSIALGACKTRGGGG